jgi:SAM-dependent methyltransferase
MEKDYEKKYHDNEYINWWFVSRRDAILRLLKDEKRDLKILDIGCAGGPLIGDLKQKGFQNIYGIDYSADAVELCKSRGFENVFLMDAHHPDFPENYFDIIIASDSLEHLEKDEVAAKSWNKILKPNGKIFVFVPAFMSLWSQYDEANLHYRRYTKHTLLKILKEAGFTINRVCYWNFMMFPPVIIYRSIQRIKNKLFPSKVKPENQLVDFNSVANSFLKYWMKEIENPFFVRFGFPVGVSVFASAKKKD